MNVYVFPSHHKSNMGNEDGREQHRVRHRPRGPRLTRQSDRGGRGGARVGRQRTRHRALGRIDGSVRSGRIARRWRALHGGIAQGIAQALLEEVRYDSEGNPITGNFTDYAIISAAELPTYELIALETPTPNNPRGAKGIGESGAIGSTPALQSAVCDALAPFGVRHIDIPVTAEKVWAAMSARA